MNQTSKDQPVSNIVNKRLKEIADTMPKPKCSLMYDTVYKLCGKERLDR